MQGAIGFEFQPESLPGSVYVDAMAGSDDYVSVMGGLRFYFGAEDKSLKARHREDDPGTFFNLLTRPAEDCVPVPNDEGDQDGSSVNYCADSQRTVDCRVAAALDI